MSDIHYLDAMTIARKIHKREISSVETTEALLSRIETCRKERLLIYSVNYNY